MHPQPPPNIPKAKPKDSGWGTPVLKTKTYREQARPRANIPHYSQGLMSVFAGHALGCRRRRETPVPPGQKFFPDPNLALAREQEESAWCHRGLCSQGPAPAGPGMDALQERKP